MSSHPLQQKIWQQIEQSSFVGQRVDNFGEATSITFHDFMNACLYDETDGYYRSGAVRVGRQGDFYTSSAIGTIMGEKLAHYVTTLATQLGGAVDVAEWGAGSGALSAHIRQAWVKQRAGWLENMNYAIVDNNPAHLLAAQQRFLNHEELPPPAILTANQASLMLWRNDQPLIVIANELLDAFPVHRVIRQHNQLWEIGVGLDADKMTFVETLLPISDYLRHELECDHIQLREGQQYEINVAALEWIRHAATHWLCQGGALVLIDYGHDAQELTAAHRMQGSLLCYYKHRAHMNPYTHIGEQDMTAHVNFSACARVAAEVGLRVAYYDTQKQFLLDQGILDDLQNHDGNPFGEIARRNRSIRQLLYSDGMSETFKVMVLFQTQKS